MAVTEVRLAGEHLSGGVALSQAAGWNQNEADWRLMLEQGEGWGLVLPDGTLVASTLVIPYGAFAWISMVLVLPAHRRNGYASRLLGTALEALARARLTPMLDATAAGRGVYSRHGFREVWGFRRCVLHRTGEERADAARPLRDTDWPWILDMDRAAFGGNRAPILRALARRLPAAALVMDGEGFILGRDGRDFPQLGPLVARNRERADRLLQAALARQAGPVYADIVDHAAMAKAPAQRGFTRMVHGAAAVPGDARRVFLVAGPELG